MKTNRSIVFKNYKFLLFIFLFAYIQSIYIRITVREEINAFTFTPEAALADLISAGFLFLIISFFIKKWQNTGIFNTKTLLHIFSVSLLVHLFFTLLFGYVIALLFDTMERNFNLTTLRLNLFSSLLNGIIYGSFFMSYTYFLRNQTYQTQLAKYQQLLGESKINQLKAQLNPHFLFNNLNILDQLIHEDTPKASQFLNEFAEIYRYVLTTSDQELVHIKEELTFAKRYFQLIEHKYGPAYRLHIDETEVSGYMVPLTLQLVIENAVQHNLGTESHPVDIVIKTGNQLQITNTLRPKRHSKTTSGRALKNLQEQYALLSKSAMVVEQNEHQFTIIIPMIHSTRV